MVGDPVSERSDRWEHFPHGADVGVRGVGASRDSAFEQAAVALTAVISDPSSVAAEQHLSIVCRAPDDEALLVEWLNALIYEMATRKMLFARFAPRVRDGELRADIWGEAVDSLKHEPAVEIKGATYTELLVDERPDGTWIAQCIVDV